MSDSLFKAMSAASSGMDVQAYRLRVVSENLSNADTHGYKRKLVSFDNVLNQISGQQEVKIGQVSLDLTPGEQLYDPGHPLADDAGYVLMSNVNMMIEMSDAREASRSYEANLTTFNQARQMYGSLLDLLRR